MRLIKNRKPKRQCLKPGCNNLTKNRFCFEHQDQIYKDKTERDAYYDKHKRNKGAAQFYKSRAWQATRKRALVRDNYLCQDCLKEGRITQADTVHHRVEISADWSKRLELDNLVSLCTGCHNARHSKG